MLGKVKREIPIYFGHLHIIFADDFNKALSKYNIPNNGEDASEFGAFVQYGRNKKKVCQYWVVFEPKATHQSIAHEVVHLVNYIFSDRRIQIDIANDEPQAYLTGWVTNEIYKAKKKLCK